MPKNILISVDQCQAEARVVAWLTKDKNMIEAVESGKFHLRNATNMYDVDLSTKEKVKAYKNTEQYVLVKACGHGGNYDMGVVAFAAEAGTTKEKATELLGLYHITYPGIRHCAKYFECEYGNKASKNKKFDASRCLKCDHKGFHLYVQAEINKKRTLYNPFGRRYVFFGRQDRETYKIGYAFIPQSTITDINKQAISALHKKWRVLLDTHDGVLFSVAENLVEQATEDIVMAYKNVCFKIWGIEHHIPVEIKVGDNWKDMTEIDISRFYKD